VAQNSRKDVEATRAKLEGKAAKDADKLADVKAETQEATSDAAEGATVAAEAARLAQGQVDRLDQHTRAGLGAGEPTPPPTAGVVGDAFGGPKSESDAIEEAGG
jgi:hypothetical protein